MQHASGKAISKAEMINLLPAQMQVMDFISELRTDLVIIANVSNPTDLNEVKETAKNMKSASLIIIAVVTNPAVTKVKKLNKSSDFRIKNRIEGIKIYTLRGL